MSAGHTGLCYEIDNLGFSIQLHQQGVDDFTVIYGKEIKGNLSYARAAQAFGNAVMHALACEGMLDNRDVEEVEES